MEKTKQPTLNPLKAGEVFKILEASGTTGMEMPLHISTLETIVVVKKGSALLKLKDSEYLLKENDVFLIPAANEHSLLIKSDFKAIVIMPVESSIQFVT